MQRKFKVGDKVKIVKYGALIWSHEPVNLPLIETDKDGMNYYDLLSDLVGKTAVVDGVRDTPGYPQYTLSGVRKHAWYDEKQLELI